MSELYMKTEKKSRCGDALVELTGVVWSLEKENVDIVSVRVGRDAEEVEIHVSQYEDLDSWALWACGQHTELVPFADGKYEDTPYQRQIVVPDTRVLVFQLVGKDEVE